MPNSITDTVEGTVNTVTDTATNSSSAVMDSFAQTYDQIAAIGPKAVGALLVLLVGYLAAKLIGRAMVAICERIGLQTAAERGGLVQSMNQVGIQKTIPQIVGLIVFWLLLCVFLMAAFNILGLTSVTTAMGDVVAYIPKLLVATVVVVVGLLIATLLRGVIATSADRVGVSYAQQLATGVYVVLSLMTFIAAFDQLGIEFKLLNYAILIAFGGAALGMGLAFGLGGRDVIGGILSGYYVRQRMQAGDSVEIGTLQGTIRDVGPVATIIETDENGLMHRHSVPNTKMLNEAVR